MEYKKILQAIENFNQYSRLVIEKCDEFSETAKGVGGSMGKEAAKIAKSARRKPKKSDDLDTMLVNLGLGIIAERGKEIGESFASLFSSGKRALEYRKARNTIIEDGLKWKESVYTIINDSFSYFEQSFELHKKLITNFQKEIQNKKGVISKSEIETLHSLLQKIYQMKYSYEKGKNIIKYFNNFQEKLENEKDLTKFINWYESTVSVNKTKCYKRCCDEVRKALFSNIKDEKTLLRLNKDFEILTGMIPILILYDSDCTENVLYEVAECLISEVNHKEASKTYPNFFYNSDGFKQVFNCFRFHFNYYVKRHYKFYTIRAIFKNFRLEAIRRCFAFEIEGDILREELREISYDFAESEKKIDLDKFDLEWKSLNLSLESKSIKEIEDSEFNAKTNGTVKELSDDEMLQAIISAGSSDSESTDKLKANTEH